MFILTFIQPLYWYIYNLYTWTILSNIWFIIFHTIFILYLIFYCIYCCTIQSVILYYVTTVELVSCIPCTINFNSTLFTHRKITNKVVTGCFSYRAAVGRETQQLPHEPALFVHINIYFYTLFLSVPISVLFCDRISPQEINKGLSHLILSYCANLQANTFLAIRLCRQHVCKTFGDNVFVSPTLSTLIYDLLIATSII